MAESVHYEDGLVQCSNVDGKKAREGRGERAGAGENVWARRNDATKKHAMRAERGGARLIGFSPNLRKALTLHFIAVRQKVVQALKGGLFPLRRRRRHQA